MKIARLTPQEAWMTHIKPLTSDQYWIENGKTQVGLSAREMFTLILFAHRENHLAGSRAWMVCFDPEQEEPNDGYISDGSREMRIEHKVIPQKWTKMAVLEAILATYKKYADLGVGYGSNRVLVIQPNHPSDGAVQISELADKIGDRSPFEEVVLVILIKNDGPVLTMHINESFPDRRKWAGVTFNMDDGAAEVVTLHVGFGVEVNGQPQPAFSDRMVVLRGFEDRTAQVRSNQFPKFGPQDEVVLRNDRYTFWIYGLTDETKELDSKFYGNVSMAKRAAG